MEGSVKRGLFTVNDHQFEVILDVGGQWNGMCHVVDTEKLNTKPDPDGVFRSEVVFTGARWDGQTITVGPLDFRRDDYAVTIEPAAAVLRRLTQS